MGVAVGVMTMDGVGVDGVVGGGLVMRTERRDLLAVDGEWTEGEDMDGVSCTSRSLEGGGGGGGGGGVKRVISLSFCSAAAAAFTSAMRAVLCSRSMLICDVTKKEEYKGEVEQRRRDEKRIQRK